MRCPTDRPVLGPSPAVPGLFHAFGFSGHGFQLGLAVGEVLADLVLKNFDGEAERDLGRWGFDVVARSTRRLPTEVAPPLPEEETIELPEPA